MTSEHATHRTGGCLCGQVRYAVTSEFLAISTCHCTNCQKQSGSALSVVAILPRSAFTVEGELSVYEDRGESGKEVWRHFCGRCGSPVLTDTALAQEQGIIMLKAGTLDDTSDLVPTRHYWLRSRQPWVLLADDTKHFQRQ